MVRKWCIVQHKEKERGKDYERLQRNLSGVDCSIPRIGWNGTYYGNEWARAEVERWYENGASFNKKFGNNAAGAVGINFKNGKGHTFNFFIDDGVVTFVDGQDIMSLVNTGRADMDKFWRAIDSQGALTLVRFDNAEIIEDAVRKVVYE